MSTDSENSYLRHQIGYTFLNCGLWNEYLYGLKLWYQITKPHNLP